MPNNCDLYRQPLAETYTFNWPLYKLATREKNDLLPLSCK